MKKLENAVVTADANAPTQRYYSTRIISHVKKTQSTTVWCNRLFFISWQISRNCTGGVRHGPASCTPSSKQISKNASRSPKCYVAETIAKNESDADW